MFDEADDMIIDEIKNLESRIRSKGQLENIPENIKDSKKSIDKNRLNISLDILYSCIKNDGKIRLFIFDIYNNKLCNDVSISEKKEEEIFDKMLSKLSIKRIQLEDKT
jgi:hypothetical protein